MPNAPRHHATSQLDFIDELVTASLNFTAAELLASPPITPMPPAPAMITAMAATFTNSAHNPFLNALPVNLDPNVLAALVQEFIAPRARPPVNEAAAFEQDTHSASNSPEIKASVKESVRKLLLRYPVVPITKNLTALRTYLSSQTNHPHCAKILTYFDSIRTHNAEQPGLGISLSDALALMYQAAQDRDSAPADMIAHGLVIDDAYIDVRMSALMEKLYESATANNGAESCIPGALNRAIAALNHAHADVVIIETKSAIIEAFADGSASFLAIALAKETLPAQKSILATWSDDGLTAASHFRLAQKTVCQAEVLRIYGDLLDSSDRQKLKYPFESTAPKPVIHPLVTLEVAISGMRDTGDNSAAIHSLKNIASHCYADPNQSLDDAHHVLTNACTLFSQVNNQALAARIEQDFITDLTRPERQSAIDRLKVQVNQVNIATGWDTIQAGTLAREAHQALITLDTLIVTITAIDSTDFSTSQKTALAQFQQRALAAYTNTARTFPEALSVLDKGFQHFLKTNCQVILGKLSPIASESSYQQAVHQHFKEKISDAKEQIDPLQKYLALTKIEQALDSAASLAPALINQLCLYIHQLPVSADPAQQEALNFLQKHSILIINKPASEQNYNLLHNKLEDYQSLTTYIASLQKTVKNCPPDDPSCVKINDLMNTCYQHYARGQPDTLIHLKQAMRFLLFSPVEKAQWDLLTAKINALTLTANLPYRDAAIKDLQGKINLGQTQNAPILSDDIFESQENYHQYAQQLQHILTLDALKALLQQLPVLTGAPESRQGVINNLLKKHSESYDPQKSDRIPALQLRISILPLLDRLWQRFRNFDYSENHPRHPQLTEIRMCLNEHYQYTTGCGEAINALNFAMQYLKTEVELEHQTSDISRFLGKYQRHSQLAIALGEAITMITAFQTPPAPPAQGAMPTMTATNSTYAGNMLIQKIFDASVKP